MTGEGSHDAFRRRMLVNITCVNALAFVGGIGLAAAMHSLNIPPDGGKMAEEQKCRWQSAHMHQSSILSECGLAALSRPDRQPVLQR